MLFRLLSWGANLLNKINGKEGMENGQTTCQY